MRGDVSLHAGAEAQAVYVQAVGKKLLAALKEPELLARFAAARDGEDLGRLRPALPTSPASLLSQSWPCG